MFALTRRRMLLGICLGCTGLVMFASFLFVPYQGLEQSAIDWLTTNWGALDSPKNPRIIYLGIDDASRNLDSLFPEDLASSPTLRLMKAGFPWNRAVYAAIADRLVSAGASAVVFDLIFPNPRAGDSTFKSALDQFGDHVVIGSNLESRDENINALDGQRQSRPIHSLPTTSLIPPPPPQDSRVGFVNVFPDLDGKIRRAHYRSTVLEFFGYSPKQGDEEIYSLAARALQKAGRGDLVPKGKGTLMLRFSQEVLPRSVYEIFVEKQWERPPYNKGALFKDKIVVIGASGNAAEDRLQTPHGTALGPTIHISAINAALNQDFLHETSTPNDVLLILGAGWLAWLICERNRRPMHRLAILAGTAVGLYILVQLLYNWTGFLPIILSPFLTLVGSGLTWSVWEQVLDRRDKAKLRRTFERYVSRDVVGELLDNPSSYLNTVGGVRKKVTILFSDVRGFTTLTESADPHALVLQLNEYFTEMVRIVFENRGTLDKFIGDAVMAHWGTIVTEGEATDARKAVAAAVQMRETLAKLNPAWKARGMLELQFGIGLNHGEVIACELGASGAYEKMEITVIGDAVNTASRLEGVTKTYHVDLCIGEQVAGFVKDHFLLRSLDLIIVKGKTRPVEIFTVLQERGEAVSEPVWLAKHEEAMTLYRAGSFTAAEQCWLEVQAHAPEDGVSQVFLERCAHLKENPPEGVWTGAFEMKSK
jgi:adenylate cyclase